MGDRADDKFYQDNLHADATDDDDDDSGEDEESATSTKRIEKKLARELAKKTKGKFAMNTALLHEYAQDPATLHTNTQEMAEELRLYMDKKMTDEEAIKELWRRERKKAARHVYDWSNEYRAGIEDLYNQGVEEIKRQWEKEMRELHASGVQITKDESDTELQKRIDAHKRSFDAIPKWFSKPKVDEEVHNQYKKLETQAARLSE
eukprot:3931789-Rhodomonas_salina.1